MVSELGAVDLLAGDVFDFDNITVRCDLEESFVILTHHDIGFSSQSHKESGLGHLDRASRG